MYRGTLKKILDKIEVGSRVRIRKGGSTYEGTLMPRSELGDERHVVIKLENGYNIGIEISGASIEELEAPKKEAKKTIAIETKKPSNKPLVAILGTGGTIASKIDYKTGAVHPAFSAEELINVVPELAEIAELKTRLLFNILSENITPKHWVQIARACAEELNSGASGVVIAHGTDTLAYTSAALSFMLKNLYKPVVLVGSQRSSDRPSSDAALNLIAATRVACSDIGEVIAVMHGSTNDSFILIHRGTKMRKMHSSRRDAFKSINVQPLGEVGEEVHTYQEYRKRREEKVVVDDKLEERVALVKIYPGIKPETLEYFVDNYKGIVIEGTGLGHVPENLLPVTAKAQEKGVAIVMTTQTLYGAVDMKVYSTGRKLLASGVISGLDMLPEVAYVKLMHVLGHARDYEQVKRLMQSNLAGEITKRRSVDTF